MRVKTCSVALRHKLVKTFKNGTFDGRLLYVKGWMGCTIQLGKKYLTAIWSQNIIGGHKETWHIEARTERELDERLDEIRLDIQEKIDAALFGFGRRAGILLHGVRPAWSRHEDWVKGEEVIDSLPAETIIHDTVFKKVYPEGMEFVGGKGVKPNAHLKNYIKNRAVEAIAPELAHWMQEMTLGVQELTSAVTSIPQALSPMVEENKAVLEALMEQVKAHLRLIKEFRDENVRYRKHFRYKLRRHDRDLREFF